MRRIDADNWAAISPYLDQALDLSEDELARWLVAVEKENPALARDLQSLIDDHRAADRSKFLEGTAPPHPLPAAGTKVGAYTLVAPIGHGGMGTVWLARRSDGRFDGPAAVKLLNVALAGSEGEARFRREGQILARVRLGVRDGRRPDAVAPPRADRGAGRQLTLPRGEVRAPPPGVRYRDGGDSRHAFCRAVCDEPAARDRRAPVRAGPPARQQAVRYRRPGPGIARQRQSATADCRHVTR